MANNVSGIVEILPQPYSFTNAFDEVVTVATLDRVATITSWQVSWDTTTGTPLGGLDGVLEFYISNHKANQTPEWTLVENATIPLGLPIDRSEGTDTIEIPHLHKAVRVKYIDNSNSGVGTFKISYVGVVK